MTSASLRRRALDGEWLIGVLLRMPGEELVEMTALAGFDFVLIDCEHGPADVVALRHHLTLATVHDVPVIVRVGQGDEALILRALDQGAQGILAPHLDNSEDAARLVTACHYPPVGERGFATYSRAGRFGTTDPTEHQSWYLENTLVLGMIESPAGVANVAGILAVPGLDGLMVGPADLAVASGPDDLPVPTATAQVNDAIVGAASLRMDIVGSTPEATTAFEDGAHLVVYNLASSLMSHLRALSAARG